jgi:23S rRNA pseudouridine955/2504/2580 synthase
LDALLASEYSWKPYLVHRLDKDTSGVLLVAKSREAARYFAGVFGSAAAKKCYIAVCAESGVVKLKSSGVIDDSILIRGETKTAQTRYKMTEGGMFENGEKWRRFELELCTGRMHQIRRHLAISGYPILGDDKYGNFALNKSLRKQIALKRLLLHANKLNLVLPSGIALDVCAPIPDALLF